MRRRRKFRTFVFVNVFLLLLFLMDYPYLSRIYNDMVSGDVIASCEALEDDADCEERLALASDYNRYLAGDGGSAPGWEDAARILSLDDSGVCGWIRIPALELILPLAIGTGDKALTQGAGILEGSSLPVGGTDTHTCISAHRGLPDRTLFTNLDMLSIGDLIEVHTLGRTLCYAVTGSETVLPTRTEHLRIRKGEDLLTLITCTPYGINTHRLYVHASRREDGESGSGPLNGSGYQLEGGTISCLLSLAGRMKTLVFWKMWWWVPATFVLLLFLFLLVRKSR
jgi:sortase A